MWTGVFAPMNDKTGDVDRESIGENNPFVGVAIVDVAFAGVVAVGVEIDATPPKPGSGVVELLERIMTNSSAKLPLDRTLRIEEIGCESSNA